MAELSTRSLAVRLSRAIKLCKAHPDWVTAQKYLPLLSNAFTNLTNAARRDLEARRVRAKEVREKDIAAEPLAKKYSRWRLSCLAVDPGLMLADFRSGSTGSDDFDINLDALMDHLEEELDRDTKANTPLLQRRFEFAEEALAELRPLRSVHDKEATEADHAKYAAEETAPRVAAAHATALELFTTWRKLVRARFGDTSAEAAALRNPATGTRGATPSEADPEVDAILPADPA